MEILSETEYHAVVWVRVTTMLSRVMGEVRERGKPGTMTRHRTGRGTGPGLRPGARHITALPETMSWISAHVINAHRNPVLSSNCVKIIGQTMPPTAEPAKMRAVAKPRLWSHQFGSQRMVVVKRLPPKMPKNRP